MVRPKTVEQTDANQLKPLFIRFLFRSDLTEDDPLSIRLGADSWWTSVRDAVRNLPSGKTPVTLPWTRCAEAILFAV